MRTIDLEAWPRRVHYKTFGAFDHPHFNMCANLDITALHVKLKQRKMPFTLAILYLIARSANAIPEFRTRIREEGVVEHEVIHPSTTILVKDDLFSFSYFEYFDDFPLFAERGAERMAYYTAHPTLENVPGKDDLFYSTALPWVSFTSFTHPMQLHPADCIPRFAWGKYFEEGKRIKMPLSVQGHHALMDGVHMGMFYENMQDILDHPEILG